MRTWLSIVFGLLFLLAFEVQAVDKAKLRWARSNPQIDSIHIEGNENFSYGEIRKHLYSRPRGLWLAIKGDRRSRVQRETLGRDTLEIKYLYLTSGFLGVRIDHSFEIMPPDSNAMVKIVIDEGARYRYGTIDLIGTYDREYHVRIRHVVNRLTCGQPVNPFELKDTEVAIRAFLANRGYPYAQVTYQVDTTGSPDSSAVTFEIESDSLVRFGNVTVLGAYEYPQSVALRELKIRQGEVYRRDDILESQRRLFESGYYTTFQIRQAEDSPDRLNPDFVLELRERKPTYLVTRAGVSKSEVRDLLWDASFGVGSRKSFGLIGPRRIEALADYSFSGGSGARLFTHRYRLKFSQPWFMGVRMPFSIAYEWQPTIKDAEQDFDRRSWSVRIAFLKWFGRKVRADFGFEYENVRLSGIPEDEIPAIKELTGNSARRKFYASIRRDSRNDLFIPTRGSVTEFSGEVYGGFLRGDADFFKLQGSWSRYRRVWPGWVSAVRVRGAWAKEFGQTESVPLDETLYIGGASSVRGFEENLLGPLRLASDSTFIPEGARYTVVFNHEFRWKTVQFLNVLPFIGDIFKRFPQWQSIFVDVGNGFRNQEEMRFDRLAVSYGTGFQIASPAGPIRIDRAWVLEHHDFEYSDRWHFTILYAF
ncbi:MAG: BamA/TamA family outer membrane protein [candidate division Zixibacteria bacterium]|nr:BamA/TamA family outer membrane protein [candidate division Zixibacteria bacterium]